MENTSIVDIICRQTDYDKETARSKLKEFDNNYKKVIQDYMGIKPKHEEKCVYASQQRYKIIRTELDMACKNYRDKQENALTE